MITEFELQSGEGTNVEIIGGDNDEFWLIVDEDDLTKMIQLAFDAPEFTLNELIDALRAAQRRATRRAKHQAKAD